MPESIADALTTLMNDPQRRAQLGQAAIARSEEFTWERAAEVHAQAFRAAAGL